MLAVLVPGPVLGCPAAAAASNKMKRMKSQCCG
jgi:hypothetical protein